MTPTQEWLARGRVPFIRHFTATTQIDVLSETSAKARSYYLFLTVHGLDHWGRYLDEFAPIDGKWLITHRREMTDAAFEGGWGAGARRWWRSGRASHPAARVLTPGSLRSMATTVDPVVDQSADARRRRALLDAPLPDLMARAAARRDAAHGARITFSPKVFIPLTMLCRDRCGYCTFAKPPARLDAPVPRRSTRCSRSPRRGAALGCHEALFTLGEAPEERYPDAAEWLARPRLRVHRRLPRRRRRRGARRDRPAPPRQRRRARPRPSSSACAAVSPSQGMMIETLADRLGEPGGPHHGAPDKTPGAPPRHARSRRPRPGPVHHRHPRRHRRDPRASGSTRSLAIADAHARHGHVQEVIVQNFLPKPGTAMHARRACHARRVPLDDRRRPPRARPTMHLQAPPNLSSRRPRARCSRPASTTGAASPRSRSTT